MKDVYTPEEIREIVKAKKLWDIEQETKNQKDDVNNPGHYTSGGIETIDYQKAKSTPEEFRGHLRLTALKYLSRAGLKDDILKDLKKAQWYVNRLVQFVETGE